MYIHIGKDFIINSKYIIAIFNIDYVKNTKEYKAMYKSLEEAGNIIFVSDKNINPLFACFLLALSCCSCKYLK